MSDNKDNMEDVMNVDENQLTPSQEHSLLASDTDISESGASNAPKETKSDNPIPSIKLSELKRQIEQNAKSGSTEMSMSLQTGVVTVERPHTTRSRPTSSRTKSKQHQKTHVNPHERIKDIPNTPKRGRETGGTPPSANQPMKKAHGVTASSSAGTSGQPLTKSQKRNLRNKMKAKQNKMAKQSGNSSSNALNAGNQTKVDTLDPPPASGSGSFGSDMSTKVGDQPNAATSQNVAVNQQDLAPMEIDMSEKPQSYAQVVDNHCVAIIDQRQPGQMQLLDQSRFDKLSTLLTDSIISMIGTKVETPVFDDTRLHSGAMRIRCANAYTRKWLESLIPKLDAKKLWHGAKMVLIDFKDLPKPHKFNVVFRGTLKSPKEIFNLLEAQNEGINTKSWTVLHCGKKQDGTHMTIGVGQDSFDTLRERSNSLYCGLGKAIFTVVKSCKVNKTFTQNASKSQDATKATCHSGNPQEQQGAGVTESNANGENTTNMSANSLDQ